MEPVVTIQEGQLQGTSGKNHDGDDFLQFFGIPYAKPPVGELRFKPPQPVDPWEGIRDATKVGSASISRDDLTKEIIGSEDCLYLNVYTKNLPSSQSKLRPVIFFIHGGGLTYGSSRPGLYGPDFLMLKDIVLVTLNYRLGVLGLLAIDDVSLGVTGNMSLKDQVLALKWVRRNIASFNGDPNNVTICGESAGSWSVHGHILSQASKGLFNKAILQSGAVLNARFWGRKNNAREIVEQLGRSASSEKEALDILMGVSAMEIYNAQEKLFRSTYPDQIKDFAAVIETPNDTAFFTRPPLEVMKEGTYNHVPMIIGYTQTEGMVIETHRITAAKTGHKLPACDLEQIIPYQLNVSKGSEDAKEICGILETLYSNDNRDYDKLTDGWFLVGIIETLRMLLKTTHYPIYLYRMSLEGKLNYFKNYLNMLNEPGTSHADDLGYLFHSQITPEIKPESPEDKSVRSFVELWTNFAEYGNPTPNDKLGVLWKPVESEENLKLLDIGEKLEFKSIPEHNRMEVWKNILKKWPMVRFN